MYARRPSVQVDACCPSVEVDACRPSVEVDARRPSVEVDALLPSGSEQRDGYDGEGFDGGAPVGSCGDEAGALSVEPGEAARLR